MLAKVEPPIGVTGNKEVVEFLRQHYERALNGGKINFAAVVTAESPTEAIQSHTGVFESKPMALVALELLRDDIKAAIVNRQIPPADVTIPANYVTYDCECEPLNFDFFCWLAYAEMTRVREGAEAPLKVGFIDTSEHQDTPENFSRRRKYFTNVVLPLVELFGAEYNGDYGRGRRYNSYAFKPIVESFKRGEPIPRLKPKLETQHHGEPHVTITLRECDNYWPHRNSNLEAWMKFAYYLQDKGERVLFIRDTEKAKEPLEGFQTYYAASVDLHARLAVYEGAKANLFVSNGPWYLALFGQVPWLMFVEVSLAEPYHANLPNWWRRNHGVAEGEQFPWSTDKQRIVWKRDTYENLVEAWEALKLNG